MADWLLTDDGELDFTDTGLSWTEDSTGQTLAQSINIALSISEGEWFLDTTYGLPYLTRFAQTGSKAFADITIQDFLRNIDGVQNILSYSSELGPDRALQVTYKVLGSEGEVVEAALIN